MHFTGAGKVSIYFSRVAELNSSTRRMKSKPRKKSRINRRRCKMKKVLTALALLSVLATPVFAESGFGIPANGFPYSASTPPYPMTQNDGNNAFAYAPKSGTAWTGSVDTFGGGSIGYNNAEEQSIMNR
jgi:hypothetical protein